MCTYIKKFSACRYLVLTASVEVRIGSPKMARNEQICAHQKVLQEVNFPKIFFKQLCTGWTVVVHICCSFLCGVRWHHNRAPNLEPRFLVNFVPVWRRIASPIMHRFGRCFRHYVTGPDVLCSSLNISRIRL